MEQAPPEFESCVEDRDELAAALGLASVDLSVDAPARVVSTGAAHLLVPAHKPRGRRSRQA
jgi:trans-2,3-dihydro-3-hydroxyanthranilate isomerase